MSIWICHSRKARQGKARQMIDQRPRVCGAVAQRREYLGKKVTICDQKHRTRRQNAEAAARNSGMVRRKSHDLLDDPADQQLLGLNLASREPP